MQKAETRWVPGQGTDQSQIFQLDLLRLEFHSRRVPTSASIVNSALDAPMRPGATERSMTGVETQFKAKVSQIPHFFQILNFSASARVSTLARMRSQSHQNQRNPEIRPR